MSKYFNLNTSMSDLDLIFYLFKLYYIRNFLYFYFIIKYYLNIIKYY